MKENIEALKKTLTQKQKAVMVKIETVMYLPTQCKTPRGGDEEKYRKAIEACDEILNAEKLPEPTDRQSMYYPDAFHNDIRLRNIHPNKYQVTEILDAHFNKDNSKLKKARLVLDSYAKKFLGDEDNTEI